MLKSRLSRKRLRRVRDDRVTEAPMVPADGFTPLRFWSVDTIWAAAVAAMNWGSGLTGGGDSMLCVCKGVSPVKLTLRP